MENLQGGTLALDHYYHLDERLRSFGLVTVYRAIQDPFEHPVQVTVYEGLTDCADADTITARLDDAARHSSRLDGDGLLPVVDFGEIEQNVPFVIEKTTGGPTLTDRMASREMFAPGDVADLIDRLAILLQNAHDQGIYHGDLRPDWILFDDDESAFDSACLTHFGLGASMRELVAMPQTVLTTDLVEAFPPESFDVASRGDDNDDPDAMDIVPDGPPVHLTAAADQWGLAALAYRLLVGVHPFFDDPVDASEGILRIKTEQPPSLTEMGVETVVADAIDRALSPDPDDRWPTITAFANALRRAVDGPDSSSDLDSEDNNGQTADDGGIQSDDRFASTPDVDEQHHSAQSGQLQGEPTGPRPSGYLLTAALVALVLSNMGWFFVTMADEPSDDDQTAEQPAADEPALLPSGLQIRTEPVDAELAMLDGDSDEFLGTTPYALHDSLFDGPTLQLVLRHDEYLDQPLSVEETDAGRDIIVELQPPSHSE